MRFRVEEAEFSKGGYNYYGKGDTEGEELQKQQK